LFLSLRTHTRHTDGTGVCVTRIDRGGAAARAGLQVSDIITAVQGRPTTTVAEFLQLVQRAPGAVTLNVNRDGRRNISLVFSPK
jgi:S1-C subfamily serine protease